MGEAALGTLITFNEFSQGTVINSQYSSVGVIFTRSDGIPPTVTNDADATKADSCPIESSTQAPFISPPNGLRIFDPPAWDDYLTITFVDPSDQVSTAFVTSFSFWIVSYNVGRGTIRAFDSAGQQIVARTSTLGGTGNDCDQGLEKLTVQDSQIWRVTISGFDDVVLDQIEFDTPQAPVHIPAASSWGLIAMAAMMLSAGGVVIKRRALGTRH